MNEGKGKEGKLCEVEAEAEGEPKKRRKRENRNRRERAPGLLSPAAVPQRVVAALPREYILTPTVPHYSTNLGTFFSSPGYLTVRSVC
jgi:hypothetical protein